MRPGMVAVGMNDQQDFYVLKTILELLDALRH
jgi:hypothetical protein